MLVTKRLLVLMIVLGVSSVAGTAVAAPTGKATCKTSRVGTIVNWPQTKVIWKMRRMGFLKTKVPKLMRRTKKIGLHTEVCSESGTPTEALKYVEREITKCFKLGLKAGGASLLTSGAKAVPVFFATFKGCVATKIKRFKNLVKVKAFTRSTTGRWKSV